MRIVMAAVAVLMGLALPAQAQVSSSERQVREYNRSMRQEERLRRFEEQYQTDRNLLRQNLDRQKNMANPSPPARFRNCPAGSVGCN